MAGGNENRFNFYEVQFCNIYQVIYSFFFESLEQVPVFFLIEVQLIYNVMLVSHVQ